MARFVTEYPFDELKILIAGVNTGMFYGHARLVEDDNPGEFYVECIKFDDGGAALYRHGNSQFSDAFSQELFARIARVIEQDKHADEFFAEQFAEHNEPDPDQARDERQDREFNANPPVFATMYGTPLVRGASLGERG